MNSLPDLVLPRLYGIAHVAFKALWTLVRDSFHSCVDTYTNRTQEALLVTYELTLWEGVETLRHARKQGR